jgi:hypothetical protein
MCVLPHHKQCLYSIGIAPMLLPIDHLPIVCLPASHALRLQARRPAHPIITAAAIPNTKPAQN